jgi:hypothetical protein
MLVPERTFEPLFRIFSTIPDSVVESASSLQEAIALSLRRLTSPSDQVFIYASDRVSVVERKSLNGAAWAHNIVVVDTYPKAFASTDAPLLERASVSRCPCTC